MDRTFDMALRLAVGAYVVPSLRRVLERGRRAILRALGIAVTVTVGAGLMLSSALLALSAWIGPIAATGLVGLILLLAGGTALLVQRKRQQPRTRPSGIGSAELPGAGPILLRGVAFAVAAALVTRLLRKRP